VYPFHIVRGHVSFNGPVPAFPSAGLYVLAAEIIDNQIQTAVSLGFTSSGNLSFADLTETITGYNPISGNSNETVPHITHLLIYNNTPSPIQFENDNIVLAMTIISSP
jgi:hypothetical protein